MRNDTPRSPVGPASAIAGAPRRLPFTVDADVDLGRRIAPYLTGADADVAIERGPVPERLAGDGPDGAAYQVRGRAVLLTIPNGTRCLVEDGRRITYAVDTPRAASELPLFLLGSAWAALCYQRGLVPLHASAVIADGAVHGFTGPSGAGKSTLAAALGARGRAFFTDDVLILDPAPDAPLCFTGQKDLKLWDDAITMTGAAQGRAVRDAPGFRKYYATPRTESEAVAGRFATLFVLAQTIGDSGMAITPVEGAAAVLELVRSVYRPAFASAIIGRRALYEALARVAPQVGVHRLSRPIDDAAFAGSVALVDEWIAGHAGHG